MSFNGIGKLIPLAHTEPQSNNPAGGLKDETDNVDESKACIRKRQTGGRIFGGDFSSKKTKFNESEVESNILNLVVILQKSERNLR